MIDDVTQHERGAVQPRDPAQRRQIGGDREVAVPLLPVRHLVTGHGVHLHVQREQVVTALDAVVDDLVEEVRDVDPLAHQPSLHVCERGHDRVDRARFGLGAELARGTASRSAMPGPPGRVMLAIATPLLRRPPAREAPAEALS